MSHNPYQIDEFEIDNSNTIAINYLSEKKKKKKKKHN